MEKCKVGVIGCGDISKVYLNSLVHIFTNTEVVAVSSRTTESARKRAEEFGIAKVVDNEELLAMDIDIAVVLTDPKNHFPIVEQCLLAGKNTYVEKPLATNTEEARRLMMLAQQRGLILSCAPDTLLGGGTQTCRKLIEDGLIGCPIASIGQTFNGGPESWHPNPSFFYQNGAGPLYDVGPYYIGDVLYLLGSAKEVSCMAKKTFTQREIGSLPHRGEMMDVEVPTYYACTLAMNSGALCTSLHSFDVPHSRLDTRIEIYGTKGTLLVSPPCDFSGEILFQGKDDSSWRVMPELFPYRENCRGIGVADMADSIIHGRSPRLTAEFAYHTLDVIESLQRSADSGKWVKINSGFTDTELMPSMPVWGGE